MTLSSPSATCICLCFSPALTCGSILYCAFGTGAFWVSHCHNCQKYQDCQNLIRVHPWLSAFSSLLCVLCCLCASAMGFFDFDSVVSFGFTLRPSRPLRSKHFFKCHVSKF